MNTLEDFAMEYLEMGFSIIPIRKGTKKPCIDWAPYQEKRADEDEVDQWFKKWPDAQIALVAGLVSGVAVVDADNSAGIQWMRNNLQRTSVYQVTKKGWHAFFKTNGQPIENRIRIADGVDVKGDNGYVLIAPSLHPSGKPYELKFPIEGEGWDDLSDFPYEILNQKNETKRAPISLEPVDHGQRNDTLTKIIGKLLGMRTSADLIMNICAGWNQTLKEPMKLEEVERTVNSIINLHEKQRSKSRGKYVRWNYKPGF